MLGWSRIENPLGAIIGIAFVVLLAMLSWAYSQEPAPTPGKESQQPQTQTTESNYSTGNYQRGTEQVPLIVKIIPATDGAEKAADKGNKELDKAAADQEVAKFTRLLFIATAALAAIAVLQLLVFGYQGYELRRTVNASRDEFLATHRPKIRIKHLWLRSDIWHDEPITVDLVCVNTGTAEAILEEVGLDYHVVRNDRAIPGSSNSATGSPAINAVFKFGGQKLPCGRNWPTHDINIGRALTAQENADIQQGRSKLYCVGFVSYLDGSDPPRMRVTGFCRVLTFPQGAVAHIGNSRFRRFRDPDFEYED
jgi:hypothetical protein